jgi:LysM repeat protein
MFRPTCLVYAASLALVGCNFANREELTHDDSTNPHYKQAQEDIDNSNPRGAIAEYEAALGADAHLAGAHYELGLIYGDKLNDPVGAIYHFQRYLELAPDAAKADQVKALIDKESQAFAASLPNSPAQSAQDYAQLQSENESLKKQVSDATETIVRLQMKLVQGGHHHANVAMNTPVSTPDSESVSVPPAGSTTPVIPVAGDAADATNAAGSTNAPPKAMPADTNAPDAQAAPATADTNAVPAGPTKPYTVKKGDSIWKIARKMYPGHAKDGEDKIMSANPGLDPKKLKPGQILQVPQ